MRALLNRLGKIEDRMGESAPPPKAGVFFEYEPGDIRRGEERYASQEQAQAAHPEVDTFVFVQARDMRQPEENKPDFATPNPADELAK